MSLATSLVKAVEQDGYDVLIVIGFGNDKQGKYTCRVATHPFLRAFSDEQMSVIHQALQKIVDAPMDDLDVRAI